MNTRRRPTSPASACIWKPWSGCSGEPTRSSSIPELRADRAVSAARPVAEKAASGAAGGRCAMKLNLVGGVVAVLIIVGLIIAYGTLFTVYQTRQALVVRLGQPVRVITEPGLNYKIPLIDSVILIDKRILDLENPAQEVIASDQKRLVVDAFARYRITEPLRFYQTVGNVEGANSRLSTLLNSALRRVLGESTLTQVVRDQREQLMSRVREQLDHEAQGLRHRHRRRAHSPRRSAGAKQPGGVPTHDHRTPARGAGVPFAGHPAGAGDPRQGRSRRHRLARRCPVEGRADSRRGGWRAQPHLRRSIRTRPGVLLVLPFDAGLRSRLAAH